MSFTMHGILVTAVTKKASDIYLSPHSAPILRIQNEFRPITLVEGGDDTLSVKECNALIESIMTEEQRTHFKENKDYDFAYGISYMDANDIPQQARFRINVFFAQKAYELVARVIPSAPQSVSELMLPPIIRDIILKNASGMILVTGTTGSGKSSTLASMIDLVNTKQRKKITTIEDPVEILHRNKLSSISQRELYTDTKSFAVALRAALRQRPDVILIGEMRDKETIETALRAAESGHLVLSTLHSLNAQETINRILDFYSAGEQPHIRNMLAETLRAVICQKLIPDNNNKIRPIVEIMLPPKNIRIGDAIRDPEKTYLLRSIINVSSRDGMQTFEDNLFRLVSENLVTPEVALKYSESRDELQTRFKKNGIRFS